MLIHKSRVHAAIVAAAFALTAIHPADATCLASERGRDAVVASVVEGNADALAGLIDSAALAARVLEGLPENDVFVKVMPGILASKRGELAENLIASFTSRGSMAVAQATSGHAAIVRKQGQSLGSGIDYVEFQLGRDGCVVDWTTLMLGVSATRLMRQNLLLSRDDAGMLATVFGVKQYDAEHVAQMRALGDAMRNADPVGALKALDGMKSLARQSFELSMLRVSLLSVDHEAPAYREALEDVAERFGDDKRTQFMLVDHHIFRGDYPAALKSINDVRRRVGIDEENELVRATLFKMMDRQQDALASLRRMVELAPARVETHVMLVDDLAQLGLHAEAIMAMEDAAEHGFVFSEEAMRADPDYAPLLASPEYAAYRAARGVE